MGRALCPPGRDTPEWLYDAPVCVLAHDADVDPLFVYANRAAQRRFGYALEEMIGLPSRLSADSEHREGRREAFESLRRMGVITGYRGLRVAKDGRRFWIENATLWNLVDERGRYRGQAAAFTRWTATVRA